jgi:thiamine kinase-like enzyme
MDEGKNHCLLFFNVSDSLIHDKEKFSNLSTALLASYAVTNGNISIGVRTRANFLYHEHFRTNFIRTLMENLRRIIATRARNKFVTLFRFSFVLLRFTSYFFFLVSFYITDNKKYKGSKKYIAIKKKTHYSFFSRQSI